MRAFKYFIGAVLLAVLFGCGKKAEIVGTVLDNFGKVVEGATVKIENTAFTATTDKNGRYHIGYVPGKVDVSILKQGYSEEKINLNIAIESKFPAKDVTLYKIPSDSGVFAAGPNDYIALKQGKLTIRQAGWMGADSTFYVSGGVATILKREQIILMDNTPHRFQIIKIGTGGRLTSKIRVPIKEIATGVTLWDIGLLNEGVFAFVNTPEQLPGTIPLNNPVYLFAVAIDTGIARSMVNELLGVSGDGLQSDYILGALSSLRASVNIYYAEHKGSFPRRLEDLVPVYVKEITKICLPQHGCSNKVANRLTDAGGWLYTNDGSVYVNCSHEKSSGALWNKF